MFGLAICIEALIEVARLCIEVSPLEIQSRQALVYGLWLKGHSNSAAVLANAKMRSILVLVSVAVASRSCPWLDRGAFSLSEGCPPTTPIQ